MVEYAGYQKCAKEGEIFMRTEIEQILKKRDKERVRALLNIGVPEAHVRCAFPEFTDEDMADLRQIEEKQES